MVYVISKSRGVIEGEIISLGSKENIRYFLRCFYISKFIYKWSISFVVSKFALSTSSRFNYRLATSRSKFISPLILKGNKSVTTVIRYNCQGAKIKNAPPLII